MLVTSPGKFAARPYFDVLSMIVEGFRNLMTRASVSCRPNHNAMAMDRLVVESPVSACLAPVRIPFFFQV